MKLRIILAAFFAVLVCAAQTGYRLRYVNGKLYNTNGNKLWQNYSLEVEKSDTNGVLAVEFGFGSTYLPPIEEKSLPGLWVEDHDKKIYGAHALVLNVEARPLPATGQCLSVCAMRIGTTNLA